MRADLDKTTIKVPIQGEYVGGVRYIPGLDGRLWPGQNLPVESWRPGTSHSLPRVCARFVRIEEAI